MDIVGFLEQLMTQLQSVNPLWAALLGVLIVLVKQGTIKLPSLPRFGSAKVAVDDTVAPLRARLSKVLQERFDEIVAEGFTEDDAYVWLLDKIKSDVDDDGSGE